MYTLLVVDDEPYLTDSLYNAFSNYDQLELEVFKAYSAPEAMDIIKQTKVDIVFSDICMPGMNGLELLSQIHLHWPHSKIIFLTGYNDFEYIQSALRNKAADFILKAEGDKPIFEALHKAVNEIEIDRKNIQYIENAREQMTQALPLLQNKYLLDFVSGFESDINEMQKQFEELGIPLNCNMPVLLFISRIDTWPRNLFTVKKMEIIYGIQNVVEQYLSASASIVPVVCNYSKLLWLVQPKELSKHNQVQENELLILQRTSQFVYQTIGLIQNTIRDVLHVPLSFAVSKAPVFWESVNIKYMQLENLLNRASGINGEVILTDEQASVHPVSSWERAENKYKQTVYLHLKKIPLLETYLESGQTEEFIQILGEILGCIDNEKQNTYLLARKVYYSIAMIFLSHIEQMENPEVFALEERFHIDKLMKIEAHSSWKDAIEYFTCLAQAIFRHKSVEYMESTDKTIQMIHNYIHRNLDGDISLNRLSEVCHFNPFYLSRLYKTVTGKSISEYISDYKFEKAREFLKQDDKLINEISTALGFANSSYFARFFKKYTNVTPKEYRDSLFKS